MKRVFFLFVALVVFGYNVNAEDNNPNTVPISVSEDVMLKVNHAQSQQQMLMLFKEDCWYGQAWVECADGSYSGIVLSSVIIGGDCLKSRQEVEDDLNRSASELCPGGFSLTNFEAGPGGNPSIPPAN